MRPLFAKSSLLLSWLLLPGLALAHTGGEAAGFWHGASHPFLGLDHLLAMFAIGLWAARGGGHARWALPGAFIGAMILGALLALGGFALPGVETGILVSVLLLGILVAGVYQLPLAASVALVSGFAVFHGFAHGAEMPLAASALSYGAGFVLASLSLHLAGLGLGFGMNRIIIAHRLAGGAIALSGLYLAVA